MLIAVPLGLGAADLPRRVRPPARPPDLSSRSSRCSPASRASCIGYFAIAFINPELVVNLFSGANQAFTLLAAGIGVGILTIPIIASVAEDSLRAVPMALREASFGLGAQRQQTSFRVVFPAGDLRHRRRRSSSACRERSARRWSSPSPPAPSAVGLFRLTPLEPGQTMTAAMAALGFGSDQVAGDDLAFQSLYFVGLLLFFMTFLLNFVSDRLVARVREVY